MHWKVTSWIPRQGTYQGCRLGPQEAANRCFAFFTLFLLLYLKTNKNLKKKTTLEAVRLREFTIVASQMSVSGGFLWACSVSLGEESSNLWDGLKHLSSCLLTRARKMAWNSCCSVCKLSLDCYIFSKMFYMVLWFNSQRLKLL